MRDRVCEGRGRARGSGGAGPGNRGLRRSSHEGGDPLPGKRIRTRVLAAAASLAVGAGLFALAPLTGGASSHREAPLVSADPQIDHTDVWAFMASDDKVALVASWFPFQEPAGGPNFFPWADGAPYTINIDNA